MSGMIQAELAATCSSLGGMHGGKYVVEPQCLESVRDIIRFLRRDSEYHEVRSYLGEAKILQTDLVHIATNNEGELFDIVVRLLVNLTNPVLLLYKEELPVEKVGRNLYMKLIGYSQEYKIAFCSVPFWSAVCKVLSELFEIDWTERSEEKSLQIERLLVLLRNVLQVPADNDSERLPDNDITVHDKVLWALRESQLLELLLYVTSNRDETKYYLHLLEIFSLLLREQNPELLASCEIRRSAVEKERDANELTRLREMEKSKSRVFKNTRNFSPTFVVKNVKSISENEVIYHKSLDKLYDLKLTQDKKRVKTPKNKCPVDSERPERRSTFSVRLFLKEFCVELLSCSFNNLMGTVKEKLVSGRGLANDESYYFWALKFFLEFACHANIDIKLISECINVQTFHFTQTQIENSYDHLVTDKKRMSTWVRRLHLMIKAYKSLLQTLRWMEFSKDQKVRESCKVLKSNIFYVVEYRELLLNCLLKYDPGKFPNSFLRDLIETNHLGLKLLEAFCKTDKIVVQKKKRVMKKVKKSKSVPQTVSVESPDEVWEKIKDNVYDLLMSESQFPEISPFDAASDVPIDYQKEGAMRNVQKYLRNKDVRGALGLFRSARQVWPENDTFGSTDISIEDEIMALQEICLSELGVVYDSEPVPDTNTLDDEENEDDDDDDHVEGVQITEQNFDIQDYFKKLVNKKIVEGCSILLSQYKQNSVSTNHCITKLLHRIAWDCKSPAMLFQASLFITMRNILYEKDPRFKELQQLAKYLIKKFRDIAASNPKIFMELLFWKDTKTAYDMEYGYGTNEEKENRGTWAEEEEDELRRLFIEFEEKMLNVDKIDWIRDNLINQTRSRIAIIRKLKELLLLAPGAKVSKKKRSGKEWTEDEASKLTESFQKFKEAMNPVEIIKERLPFAKSKKDIKDKLVELGLVTNVSELRKKRSRKGKPIDPDDVNNDSDNSINDSDSSDDDRYGNDYESDQTKTHTQQSAKNYATLEIVNALRKIEKMTEALEWVKETFGECMEEDSTDEGYPLLALDGASAIALDNEDFQNVLRLFDLTEPCDDQLFWKIPPCSKLELNERLELLNAAISSQLDSVSVSTSVVKTTSISTNKAIQSDESSDEDEFEKLRRLRPNAAISSPVANNESGPTNKVDRLNDSSDEDEFEKLRRLRPNAVSRDDLKNQRPSNNTNGKSKRSVKNNRTLEGEFLSNRGGTLESDDSDTGMDTLESNAVESHPIDSDRSDKGDRSDNEGFVQQKKPRTRRPTCLASDSEGEGSPPRENFYQKRRRCIGSDSEVEERPSDDEGVRRPLEVRKRSRMIDSDSDLEGHGSTDDAADVQTSQ